MSGILPEWLARWLGVEAASPGEGTTWSLENTWSWAPWATLVFAMAAVGWFVYFYAREGTATGRAMRGVLVALRLALVAKKRGAFETVHQALFDAMWVYEKDLNDKDVLAEIAAKASLSLEDIEDPAIKDELKANTNEACERGAFGAPTFFVDDQMFFGNDRFDFIKDALDNRSKGP